MKVYSSPSHHFRKPPGASPLGFSGAPPEGSSSRSSTVDWFCLGPAQQRSCIASWGCGPSSRGPDLTIPPCGCHRPATGSVLCPHRIRTGFCLTAGAQRRVKRSALPAGAHKQWIVASCSGSTTTTKYFVLRWQPGTSLPFSNSLASFCPNQPTSSKVDVERAKKKKIIVPLHPN